MAAEFHAPPFASDSVPEDDELNLNTRTVATPDGGTRPLTEYEKRRVRESAEDVEMRRQAAAAPKLVPGMPSAIDQFRANMARVRPPLNTGEDANYTVSPSINEQRITSLTTGDATELAYLQTGIGFLKSTRETLEKVSKAYEALRADQTLTPEARSLKMSDAADRAHDVAYKAQHAAIETITKQIAHVDNELATPLTSVAHTSGMSEIRSVLRTMPADQRRTVIQQAISADTPTKAQQELINAALGAHFLIAGLNEEEQATYTRQLNTKRNPELVRRRELLQKSLAIVHSVGLQVLTTEFEGAHRATFRKSKSLRALSDNANQALEAIFKTE
ncbi:MAG TPA: hypothetical protein VI653_09490 [Steroidobacteraceae bacterium]